jgi:hypothetical protein
MWTHPAVYIQSTHANFNRIIEMIFLRYIVHRMVTELGAHEYQHLHPEIPSLWCEHYNIPPTEKYRLTNRILLAVHTFRGYFLIKSFTDIPCLIILRTLRVAEKSYWHKMCYFIFPTTFLRNIFRSNKYSEELAPDASWNTYRSARKVPFIAMLTNSIITPQYQISGKSFQLLGANGESDMPKLTASRCESDKRNHHWLQSWDSSIKRTAIQPGAISLRYISIDSFIYVSIS